MRKAQYVVPGDGGDAECVIYYFGPQQGGPPEANAQRWASQFTTADGTEAKSELRTIQVRGIDVLLIESTGIYSGGFMGDGKPLPAYRLLGAIATGPDANWFFKLTGPDATVAAQRDAFLAMMQSLARGTASAQP